MHLHNICEPTTTDEDDEEEKYNEVAINDKGGDEKTIKESKKSNEKTRKERQTHLKGVQSRNGFLTSSFPATQVSPCIVSNSLRTILLQDNRLTENPNLLLSKQLFPALRVIQLHGNPIRHQTKQPEVEIYAKNEGISSDNN